MLKQGFNLKKKKKNHLIGRKNVKVMQELAFSIISMRWDWWIPNMLSASYVLSTPFIILWMQDFLSDLRRPSHRTPSSLSVLPRVIHSLSFTVQWFLQQRQALQTWETRTCQLSWNADTVANCTNQKLIMTERGVKTVHGQRDSGKVGKYQISVQRWHLLRAWCEMQSHGRRS